VVLNNRGYIIFASLQTSNVDDHVINIIIIVIVVVVVLILCCWRCCDHNPYHTPGELVGSLWLY